MDSAYMLKQILATGEAGPSAALTVLVRTQTSCLGSTMLAMNFTLVAMETTGIRKALNLLATRFLTDVRTGVLLGMFSANRQSLSAALRRMSCDLRPFTKSGKQWRVSGALCIIAEKNTLSISRWLGGFDA